MNKHSTQSGGEEIASAIHLEYIRNLVEFRDGDGIEEVEAFHRSIFLNHYGKDLEHFQQRRRTHEDRLEHLEARLTGTRAKLSAMEKWLPAEAEDASNLKPAAPWNMWDLAMFVAALLGIVGLLVFGVLNVSFNLLESGIITFLDHPIRAYFWAALLPVGALSVKIGWDFLHHRTRREVYLWTCLAIGLTGVLVWVTAYASVYPTLSKTTDEHIESLRVYDQSASPNDASAAFTSGGAKRLDMIIVAAQAVAEIFLSAVLGIFMTVLYARHRPVRLARNSAFVQLDEERRRLEGEVAIERSAVAEAKGSEEHLQHQLAVFVAFAKSLFEKETARRRDAGHQKRRLLDQLTEHIKSQLDAVDDDGGDGSHDSQTSNRLLERKPPV